MNTIDTPEFLDLICKFAHESSCEEFNEAEYNAAREALVAHINAYGQQQRNEGAIDGRIHQRGVDDARIKHLTHERDLARKAATAAVGRDEKASTVQGMADCMDMVRQELVDAGIISANIAPMFVASAVAAWGAELRERAEKAEATIADLNGKVLELNSEWRLAR